MYVYICNVHVRSACLLELVCHIFQHIHLMLHFLYTTIAVYVEEIGDLGSQIIVDLFVPFPLLLIILVYCI